MGKVLAFEALIALLVVAALASCSSDRAHENYEYAMQLEVGKPINDRYLTRNEYPDRLLSKRTLPNGHVEEEYESGIGLRCHTFFEIDQTAEKIVAWRYEGTKDDCAVRP